MMKVNGNCWGANEIDNINHTGSVCGLEFPLDNQGWW